MRIRQGTTCSLKVWQERFDKHNQLKRSAVENIEDVPEADTQFALVINQSFDETHKLDKMTLTVNSPFILSVFREVIVAHPTVASDFAEPFDMEAPFQMLLHFWDELFARRETGEDDDERMHLNLLLKFMESDMGEHRRTIVRKIESGMIDYDTLWALYRPRDVVVTFENGQPWLLEVVKTAYEENKSLGKFMEVHCIHTDYDGEAVGEAKKIFRIIQKRSFAQTNPSPIIELDIYPRRFLTEGDTLETRLLERGKHFLTFQGVRTMQCSGSAKYLQNPPPSYWHPDMGEFELIWLPYTEVGRVIVDRRTFRQDNLDQHVAVKGPLTDYDHILCPPHVYGYSVARMEWCIFYLSTLSDIEWDKAGFDALILPEQQLRLVRAAVTSHDFPASEGDEARKKGRGMVVLLHGPPGVGKTMTAECSAEATHRALISTSLHQLNKYDMAYYFDRELKKVLRYATIWKAIVLFDEADVFLEARSEPGSSETRSGSRNALTAVFLHHLEYFSGIVFLTTNLVRVFDTAMKSRIHLAIRFAAPDAEARSRIWRQNLQKVSEDRRDLDLEKIVHELSSVRFNGREVSNAVSTASTLAHYENAPLRMSHLQVVIGVRHEFEQSLQDMQNSSTASDRPQGFPLRRASMLNEET